MTTDVRSWLRTEAIRNAELLERTAEAKLQTTLQTAAFVLGALLGFMIGFSVGMWKAFDIVSKVIP